MIAGRGRKPLRQVMRENALACNFYAAAAPAGKLLPALPSVGPRPEESEGRTPSRGRRDGAPPAPTTEPTEREIRKAIVAALKARPDVAFVGEFNRGAAVESGSRYEGGAYRAPTQRHIAFNTVAGFPDIHGLLNGGRPFYIEVKRRKGGRLTDEQRAFLFLARQAGAIAGVATSVAEALGLLDSL